MCVHMAFYDWIWASIDVVGKVAFNTIKGSGNLPVYNIATTPFKKNILRHLSVPQLSDEYQTCPNQHLSSHTFCPPCDS